MVFMNGIVKVKQKTPFLITSENEPILLGGVWDVWERDDACIESFAIITTDASPTMSWLHDRQPIFIPESNIEHWLNARTPLHELGRYLVPNLPYSLQAFPVANSVGNSRVKAPISIIGAPTSPKTIKKAPSFLKERGFLRCL